MSNVTKISGKFSETSSDKSREKLIGQVRGLIRNYSAEELERNGKRLRVTDTNHLSNQEFEVVFIGFNFASEAERTSRENALRREIVDMFKANAELDVLTPIFDEIQAA